MMQFMHSHRSGSSLAPRGAAILIAALAGGCSAEISRFDYPSFSLTGEKQNETASLQSSGANRGPQTASNGYGSSYDRGGYTAPRSNRDGGVAMANLPDASQQSKPTFNYADERRRRAGIEPTRTAPPRAAASRRERRGAPRRHAVWPVAPASRLRRGADGGQPAQQSQPAPGPAPLSAPGLFRAALAPRRRRACGRPSAFRRRPRASTSRATRCARATRSTASPAPTA